MRSHRSVFCLLKHANPVFTRIVLDERHMRHHLSKAALWIFRALFPFHAFRRRQQGLSKGSRCA